MRCLVRNITRKRSGISHDDHPFDGDHLAIGRAPSHPIFLSDLRVALFGGFFLAFPLIAMQVWRFVAPGLYRNERSAFWPFLAATPILFALGASLVYFFVAPMAFGFFLDYGTNVVAGVVPGYSGGTAEDSHLLPASSVEGALVRERWTAKNERGA